MSQHQNLIDIGFDIEGITEEKKQVLNIFVDLFGKLQEYDGTKFNPLGGGGLADLKKSMTDGQKVMGEYNQLAQKFNDTILEQAKRVRDLAKAHDELAKSRKGGGTPPSDNPQPNGPSGAPGGRPGSPTNAQDKEAQKIQDQLAATQAKIAVASSDAAKELAAQKLQLQQLNTENKNAAKEALGLTTAYQKLEAEFKAAFNTATELGLKLGTDAEEYKVAAAAAEALNAKLKELDADGGKFNRNVGNYKGAFSEAFEVIKQQAEEARKELASLQQKGEQTFKNFGGTQGAVGFDNNRHKPPTSQVGGVNIATEDVTRVQQLTDKLQAFNGVIGRAEIGFKSSRQEAKAFQEAAIQLGIAVGQESEEFLVFNKAVGEGLNGINDLKAATKFQASDAKVISGLADAASTLAGAFGAAQAAMSLFGQEDEDLQKQMAKFQQLLVLINGLQAVANGLQAESGGMQLLLSARTSLLNAAKGFQLLLTTKAVQAIAAETAATSAGAAAKEADVAATEQQVAAKTEAAAATAANTAATTASTAATTGAAAATTSLTTSLIAGGLATLLLAAGAGLALLTAKLIGYGKQTGITIQQQKDILDATKELNDALEAQAKIYADLDTYEARYYNNLLANAQAAGANQYEVLLAQKKLDDFQTQQAQDEIDRLGVTSRAYVDAANAVQRLRNQQAEYAQTILDLNKIPEDDQTKAQKAQLKAAKDNLEINKTQLSIAEDTYAKMTKARQDLSNARQKSDEDDTKFNRLSLDEQLAANERAATLTANLIKAKNAIVLGSDASTLNQRLAAIRSNAKQENDILDAQADRVKNNPSNLINGLLSPEAQGQIDALTEKRKENFIKSQDDLAKIRRQYYERDRDANLAAFRAQIEEQIRIAQDLQQGRQNNPDPLSAAPKVPLSDRIKGLSDEYQARRDLLNAELKVELDKEGLTQRERVAIYEKYGSDIDELWRGFHKSYLDLEKEAQEQSLAEWALYYQVRKNQIDNSEIDQLKRLEEARQKDLINVREYNRQKQKIEDEAALARAQIAVRDAFIQVNATKDGTKERADAQDKLTATVKALNNQVVQNNNDSQNAVQDKVLNTLHDIEAGYHALSDVVGAVLDIGYQAQKAQISDLEASQEKSYEKQIAQVQSSSQSEEEKAARTKVLEGQRMAQKEENDRKERKIEQERAAFERASAITGIILSTTEAIVGFLKNPGGFAGIALSVAAGVTGAAQLARAVATQVPHYKDGAGVNGRPLHSGGPAVVGDGYEEEIISEPGKKPYLSPAIPTRLNLAPNTSVIPMSMLNEMSQMWVTDSGILSYRPDNSDMAGRMDKLNNTMERMTDRLDRSIRKTRQPIIIQNNIGKDLAWQAWVQKNVKD